MVKDWLERGPSWYAAIQKEILQAAPKLLRPGGLLLYSTCTFSETENEGSILELLKSHPDFSVVPLPNHRGFASGRPDLLGKAVSCEQMEQLKRCVRIYPHRMNGEGHFLALLKKAETLGLEKSGRPRSKHRSVDKPFSCPQWEEFASGLRRSIPRLGLRLYDQKLYSLPAELWDVPIHGLRFLRTGLYLGDVEKKRFTPSQALAMALKKEEFASCLDFSSGDERIIRYLKGETLDVSELGLDDRSGWQLVCVDGFPLGWAKLVNGSFRNKYYPGWRWQHAAG